MPLDLEAEPGLETASDPLEPGAHRIERRGPVSHRQIDEIDVDREARKVANEQVDRSPAFQGEIRLGGDLRDRAQQECDLVEVALGRHRSPASMLLESEAGMVIW